MRKFNWLLALRWLVSIFFVFGGIGNIFASAAILEDYQRWGYPDWFHYLTGVLELATAALLITPLPIIGALLGAAIMAAAAGTVIAHAEYTHAIPPLVVLAVCALLSAALTRQQRRR